MWWGLGGEPYADWRHMWDQTGDKYKKLQREHGARASEAKKREEKQATSEDDKKSEARQVKGMKMKRHIQTACFSETWRWRNKAQVKSPLELIQTRTHSR